MPSIRRDWTLTDVHRAHYLWILASLQGVLAGRIPSCKVLNTPKAQVESHHLGSDTGLQAFDLVEQTAQRATLIQCPAFARAHRHMPAGVGLLSFAHTVVVGRDERSIAF